MSIGGNLHYVIYKLTWPEGCYVGMTSNLGGRLAKHDSDFRTGNHHCSEAQKNFRIAGSPKVEVLTYTKSVYEARRLERKHIRLCKAVNSDGKQHINTKARQRAFFGGRV